MKCGREAFENRNTEAIELDNGCLLVIRNIPCHKCRECDEVFCTGNVVEQIEQIVSAAMTMTQELMVVDYTAAA